MNTTNNEPKQFCQKKKRAEKVENFDHVLNHLVNGMFYSLYIE